MIEGKTIILLGSRGLIGKNIEKSILEKKANLISVDLNQTESENDNILRLKADITNSKSLKKIIGLSKKKFQKIDALINCSYPKNNSFGKENFNTSYKNFCENLNLHLGGFFESTKVFFNFFKIEGKGTIINFSSIYGSINPRFELYESTDMKLPIEYVIAKSGVVQLTKYFASCSKGLNININSISPGGIEDNQPHIFKKKYNSMSLNKGLLKASDINELVIFLLSDGAKNINGQNIVIDDGFSL
tara:strand:+ start:3157 stop:3894 length:738 start_codon:yes stop_codon:yes gene_type:complete